MSLQSEAGAPGRHVPVLAGFAAGRRGVLLALARREMQITVNGEHGAVDTRTRAYVEYRVFDRLRVMEHDVRDVDVSLHRGTPDTAAGRVTCRITARLASGGVVTTTASAEWPYKAIDAAVQALTEGVPAGARR